MTTHRKIIALLVAIVALPLVVLLFSNFLVEQQVKNCTNNLSQLNKNRVGLVLGTSRYLSNGNINLYFKYRIEAAVALYEAGKIEYIIVSGDNSVKSYNEPVEMQKALIAAGIPKSKVYLDYAGFRTLDSVVRCNKIFGQTRFTIISQAFHNKRALYIAQHYGYQAVAYNAKAVNYRYGFKTQIREYFARTKMLLDLYLLNKQPKFLGEPVIIPA